MSYISSTFIAAYNAATDTSIVLVDSIGNRVAGLNVAKITKVAQEEKAILIVLESGGGNDTFSLDFNSVSDAKLGLVALTTAINTLYTNAIKLGLGVTVVNAPQTIVAKTLAQYITLANTNALVPLQWYAISDSGNTFGIGTSYNVWALANNDTKPTGVVPSSKVSFQLDVIGTTILSYNDPRYNFSTLNGGTITSDILSARLYAFNNGIINSTNSTDIQSFDSSNLTVTDCDKIVAKNGANIVIEGVSGVEFDGITANIGNYYAGRLANVKIDAKTTTGAWEWPPEDLGVATTADAYVDPKHYELRTALSSNKVVPLKNKFVEANATFTFEVSAGYIGNYTITVQDEALATLIVLDNAYEGATVEFKWDKDYGDWKLGTIYNTPSKNGTLVASIDGQTTFALPTKAITPTKARFYINGLLQSYGVSKDYYITNNILTYNALDYGIKTTDSLEIIYI